MKQILPFLNFDGNCREAMEFYKQCLGAELFLMPYSDAPSDQTWVTPESRDRILHSTLKLGSDAPLLMAADVMPGMPFQHGSSFAVVIECDSAEEIDTFFAALSAGGEVTMELQNTFWNARFGMLTDKFGVRWMLNYTLPKPA
jgi:PhnB protein